MRIGIEGPLGRGICKEREVDREARMSRIECLHCGRQIWLHHGYHQQAGRAIPETEPENPEAFRV